jgi:hypothetical protein
MIRISYTLNASASCSEVHWFVPDGQQYSEYADNLEKKNCFSILRLIGYTENILDPVHPFKSIFEEFQSFKKKFLTIFFDLNPVLPNETSGGSVFTGNVDYTYLFEQRLINALGKESAALVSFGSKQKFSVTIETNFPNIIDLIWLIEDIPTIPSFIWHDTSFVEPEKLNNILELIEPTLGNDRNIFALSKILESETLLFDNNPSDQDHCDYVICMTRP